MWVNRPAKAFPRVKAFFQQLRKAESLPVGAAGFCWGAKIPCMLSASGNEMDGKCLADAGFSGHPSMLSLPDDMDKVSIPLSIAVGDRDSNLTVEQSVRSGEPLRGSLMARRERSRSTRTLGTAFA